MMSYEEAAAEIKRRRDECVTKRKSTYKKLAITLCALCVCASAGVGTWMLSRDGEEPNIPGGDTFVPSYTETEEQTTLVESESIDNGVPPPNSVSGVDGGTDDGGYNGGYWSENKLDIPEEYIIKGDEDVPRELMTYKIDYGDRNLTDNNYEAGVHKEYYAGAMANLRKYVSLLYGEDNIDDEQFGIYTYNTDDPYVDAVIENGERPIRGWSGHIKVSLDITWVEKYRSMTQDEAYEYLTDTPYYKTAIEFLGIEDEWITFSVSGRAHVNNYNFTVSEYDDDVFTAQSNREQRCIEMTMEVYEDRLYAIINIYDNYDLVEQYPLKSISYDEGLEGAVKRLNEKFKVSLDEDMEAVATVEYGTAQVESGETHIVPYYIFYFGTRNENGDFIWEHVSRYPMVADATPPSFY